MQVTIYVPLPLAMAARNPTFIASRAGSEDNSCAVSTSIRM